MRKLYLAMGLALVTMLVASGAVYAAVTFDSSTGKGFVGKGDVQTALHLNNAQMQAQASSLVFTYVATDNYSAVCTFTTGEGTRGEQTHNISHTTSTNVNDTVAYDPRVRNQITGFNLTGFGATSETGTVPVVGDPCPGNAGTDGVWSSVNLDSSTGALFVNGVQLNWPAPTV